MTVSNAGYRITEQVYESRNPLIYQTHRCGVILMALDRATTGRRATSRNDNPRTLKNLLACTHPKQSGRMNQTEEYRAFFYSRDATSYQLLTGQPPFPERAPMNPMHCHRSREPKPPGMHKPADSERVSLVLSVVGDDALADQTFFLRMSGYAHVGRKEVVKSPYCGDGYLIPYTLLENRHHTPCKGIIDAFNELTCLRLCLANTPNAFALPPQHWKPSHTQTSQMAVSLKNAMLNGRLKHHHRILAEQVTGRIREVEGKDKEPAQQNEKILKARQQLVTPQNMVPLDVPASGVAHKINIPINFAHGGAQNLEYRLNLVTSFLFELKRSAPREVLAALKSKMAPLFGQNDLIQEGSRRIKPIAQDLRRFTRKYETSGDRVFGSTVSHEYTAVIPIADNGFNRKIHTMEKIFQPRYTGQEVGAASGLGRSNHCSIAQQYQGHLPMTSTVGESTTFTIQQTMT